MSSEDSNVSTIVKGRVYSIGMYAPFYGKETKVTSTSIKLLSKGTTIANPGIRPVDLLDLVHLYYKEKEDLSSKEHTAKATLEALLTHLKDD